jgi:hypothetical protein
MEGTMKNAIKLIAMTELTEAAIAVLGRNGGHKVKAIFFPTSQAVGPVARKMGLHPA